MLAYRVHAPNAGGTCVARDIALAKGTWSPVNSAMSFDVNLELTVDGGAVVGVHGDAHLDDDADEQAYAWRLRLAQAVDGDPESMAPPSMRWLIEHDQLRLVLISGLPWHTPVVVAHGSHQIVNAD